MKGKHSKRETERQGVTSIVAFSKEMEMMMMMMKMMMKQLFPHLLRHGEGHENLHRDLSQSSASQRP